MSETSFVPKRYAPDGGFGLGGAMLLLSTASFLGLLLGVLAGWISQYFYFVGIFPLAIGLIIGGVGHQQVSGCKIRNPLLGALAGLLGGGLAIVAMHYTQYLRFCNWLDQVPAATKEIAARRGELDMRRAELPEPVQRLLRELAADPELAESLTVRGFLDYVDFSARRGISIEGNHPHRDMHFGYVGSYLYWGSEWLIVTGLAFFLIRVPTTEPFCTRCQLWKSRVIFGLLAAPAEPAAAALAAGNLAGLSRQLDPDGPLGLFAHVCPRCQGDSPVDVSLVDLPGLPGSRPDKRLACWTYPGESLTEFTPMFAEQQDELDFAAAGYLTLEELGRGS